MSKLARSALITAAVLTGASAGIADPVEPVAGQTRTAPNHDADNSPDAVKAFWQKVQRQDR